MKPLFKQIFSLCLAVILLAGFEAAFAQDGTDSFITISGMVKDSKTHDPVAFASVSVPATDIGTVTNSEGEFSLKINKTLNAEFIEIAHLSFTNKKFKIAESLGDDRVFYLEQHVFLLTGISIRPKEPKDIVLMALKSIKKNYSEDPNMMTGFYRESIRQRRDYLSISEAVVDIHKAGYSGLQGSDQVRISKGRKGNNVKKADTLMVQLQGGPNVLMLLDVVKNTDLSIGLDNLDNYTFELNTIVNIDDQPNYVISFSPNVVKTDPLYYGKLYINQESLAITRAEFSLDISDEDKASRQFVQRKPSGLIFMPTSTSYLVTYKENKGKYYLNYVRIELKFRCDWKKKWFRNYYTIVSEVAITDRHEDNIVKFANQELFKSHMILADKIQFLGGDNYWGAYNIIEPEESIQNAYKKFTKGLKK